MTTTTQQYEISLGHTPVTKYGSLVERKRGKWPLLCMAILTVGLLATPGARLLVYLFPMMALLVGAFLYRRNLTLYVSFCSWLWFLTPLVRRLVDYRAGWIPATAVLLAPLMALYAPSLWIIKGWRRTIQKQTAPMLCFLAVCTYATFMGMMNFPIRFVFQDLVTWAAPVSFALVLFTHRARAVEMYRGFESAFLYGSLLAGVYGVVQFFILPGWDRLWMEQMNLASLGIAEPLKVRVFSTMNSPQILASFLVAGLLIAINSNRKIRYLSIPAALVCLVLSLARSGWIAMAAGFLYLMFKLAKKQRLHLVVVALLALVALVIAMQNPDIQQVISERFDTLSNAKNDVSFMDRVDGYRAVFTGFMDNPFGLGMGATPAVSEDRSGTVGYVHGGQSLILGDSTVITIVTTMGFAGGLVLLLALIPLVISIFRNHGRASAQVKTMRALFIGLTAEALLDAVVAGPTGFLTWACVGFCLALTATHYRQDAEAVRVA